MLRRHWLATSLAAAFSPVPARAEGFGKLTEAHLKRWLLYADVPGIAMVSVGRGKASYLNAGTRDTVTPQPVTQETIFAAASLSKQVVAYGVLDLNRRGKWDLDRPLGDFASIDGSPEAGRITARMALSHSSGFPNWRFEAGQKLVPDAEPGRKFRYSGEGYCYLQRVMEKITGKPMGRYLRETVFQPLGMQSTTFGWRTPSDRTAVPHTRQGLPMDQSKQLAELNAYAEQIGKDPEDWTCADCEAGLRRRDSPALPNNFPINAAASLKTCTSDYAKFLTAALTHPEFGQKQVTITGSGGVLGWGLGWGIESVAGRTFWWQWGDNSGFKNFVLAEPAAGAAIAVFTNGDKGRVVYDRAIQMAQTLEHPALLWV